MVQCSAALPGYIPHYTPLEQVIGATVLVAILVITAVTVIVVVYRRR